MGALTRRRPDLTQIQPTSKLTLKLTCLAACNNNVREAQELYEYLAGDMTLPDMDPERPTTFGQIRQGAEDVYGWVQSHRDELIQGYELLKGIRRTATTATGVAPIPEI